jgi:uncharacterized protein (DUF2141 family)
MSTRRLAIAAALLAIVLAGAPAAHGADSAALDIVRRLDSDEGPRTMRGEMTLRIYADAASDRVTRVVRLLTMTRRGAESYTEFLAPANIAGIRMLQTADTLLVYFPSTGRVRPITGRARTGSVGGVGGDFTYEDIDAASLQATYTDFRLVDDDARAWRISAVPLASGSAYERVTLHVEKNRHVVTRIDYFAGNEQVKRMDTTGFTSIVGRSVATEFTMVNLKAGSKSVLRIDDLEWNILLRDRLFDPNRFHQ